MIYEIECPDCLGAGGWYDTVVWVECEWCDGDGVIETEGGETP